jgi:subtilisin family serine protease
MNVIKIITRIELLIVLTTVSGYAQFGTGSEQRFYYAYEKRIALEPLADKVVIRLKEGEPSKLNSLLSKSSLNSGDYTIETLGKKTFQLSSAANTVSDLMNRMKDNRAIHTLQPVYTTRGGAELGITDEIVVEFLAGITSKQKEKLHRSLGVTVKKSKKYYDVLSVAMHGDALAIANAYQESGLVKYAHPNFLVEVQFDEYTPNDEYFHNQFFLHNTGQPIDNGTSGMLDADVDAPEAWEITKGNPDIVIAIHDGGVSLNHPDIQGNIWTNPNEGAGDANGDGFPGIKGVDDDGDGLVDEDSQGRQPGDQGYTNDLFEDDDENGYNDDFNGWDFNGDDNDPSPAPESSGHGNACAGIVAAVQDNQIGVSGIAPLCKIMPISRGSNSAEVSDDADALYYAWENGADVFSQSFSHYCGNITPEPVYYPNIREAIIRATTLGRGGLGMVLCFSTGNTGDDVLHPNCVNFPASVDIAGVLAVGASNRYDLKADYSPTNPLVDIVATSSHVSCNDIWTIDTPGDDGYNPGSGCGAIEFPNNGTNYLAYTGHFGGTSAATPLVAGIAALVLSVDPCLTQLEVYDLLTQTADKVPPYEYVNGRCDEMGFGRVNAYNALARYSQDRVLQNMTVDTGQQEKWVAVNSITAAGAGTFFAVEPGGNAIFYAGVRINLKPGFAAQPGSQFYAAAGSPVQSTCLPSFAFNGSPSINNRSQIGNIDKLNIGKIEVAAQSTENSLWAAIPFEFSLSQNFPNPFNPVTTIKYALKEDARVSLKIYNMLGQEVKTMVNEHQPAGFKEVVWDGTNDNGHRTASGVYIYRIVAGNYIDMKKMIMLK